jgi:hypothetical protein
MSTKVFVKQFSMLSVFFAFVVTAQLLVIMNSQHSIADEVEEPTKIEKSIS